MSIQELLATGGAGGGSIALWLLFQIYRKVEEQTALLQRLVARLEIKDGD